MPIHQGWGVHQEEFQQLMVTCLCNCVLPREAEPHNLGAVHTHCHGTGGQISAITSCHFHCSHHNIPSNVLNALHRQDAAVVIEIR